MAGYWTYDEWEGEAVHRMYDRPFMVRAKNPEGGPDVTVTAFPTLAEAEACIEKGACHWGKENCWVENWNEDAEPASTANGVHP